MTELVEDAKKHGAKIITGGNALGSEGYFYAADHRRQHLRRRAAGRRGAVRPRAADHRIQGCRRCGAARERDPLRAQRFGVVDDMNKAAEVAAQLECGSAWVNQHLAIAPNLPFGGAKWSGIGVENGPWGLLGFTEIQVVNVAKN